MEHYKRLQLMNESPDKCLENHKNIFKDKWISNFERSVEDIDSRLAPYKQINPTLTAPPYFNFNQPYTNCTSILQLTLH